MCRSVLLQFHRVHRVEDSTDFLSAIRWAGGRNPQEIIHTGLQAPKESDRIVKSAGLNRMARRPSWVSCRGCGRQRHNPQSKMKPPGRDQDRLVEPRNRRIGFVQEGLSEPPHDLTQTCMVALVRSNPINEMESRWNNALTIGSAKTGLAALVRGGFLKYYGVGRITVCRAGGWSPLSWGFVPRRARRWLALGVFSSRTPSPTPRSAYGRRNGLRNHRDLVCVRVDLKELWRGVCGKPRSHSSLRHGPNMCKQ